MASSDDKAEVSSVDEAELKARFADFVKLSSAGKPNVDLKLMTSKACGKMIGDTLPRDLVRIADASVFPKCKEKGKHHMHVDHFPMFIHELAYEFAKMKTKNNKLPKDDPKVKEYEADFRCKICKRGPKIKEVKTSKTGCVDGLTDTSQYTGSHKERFDEDGKGKGISGRENLHANKGYVGNYKGEGTFGTKK